MEYSRARRWPTACARPAAARSGAPVRRARSRDALEHAHRAGIVHRDLKPGNIMLTKIGREAARLRPGQAASRRATIVAPTRATAAASRSPQRRDDRSARFSTWRPSSSKGSEADARTDIFAFGAVLYEMVTGKRAFEGKTKTSLIAAIVDRDPPPIAAAQPLTPPRLERDRPHVSGQGSRRPLADRARPSAATALGRPAGRGSQALNPFDTLAAIAVFVRRRVWQRAPEPLADDGTIATSYWPAVAGLLAFQWLNLCYHDRYEMRRLALIVTAYSVLILAATARYGRAWLRTGEAFTAFFGLIARMAPFTFDRDTRRVARVRAPFSGLSTLPTRPGITMLVLASLGGTTFEDGVSRTTLSAKTPRLVHRVELHLHQHVPAHMGHRPRRHRLPDHDHDRRMDHQCRSLRRPCPLCPFTATDHVRIAHALLHIPRVRRAGHLPAAVRPVRQPVEPLPAPSIT